MNFNARNPYTSANVWRSPDADNSSQAAGWADPTSIGGMSTPLPPPSNAQYGMNTTRNISGTNSYVPRAQQDSEAAYRRGWLSLRNLKSGLQPTVEPQSPSEASDLAKKDHGAETPPGSLPPTDEQRTAFDAWWDKSSGQFQQLLKANPRRPNEKAEDHFVRVVRTLPRERCSAESIQSWKAWVRVVKICASRYYSARGILKNAERFQLDTLRHLTARTDATTHPYKGSATGDPSTSSAIADQVRKNLTDNRARLYDWTQLEEHAVFAQLTPEQALSRGAWEAFLQTPDE